MYMIRFKITGTTVTYQNAADNPDPRVVTNADNTEYTIQNEPGEELPGTGGTDTRLIYLAAIALTALTGAGLVLKHRYKAI